MGEKGKGKGKEVRWRRDLDRGCSTGFWDGESAGQNGKYRKLKEVREEKEVRECGMRHKQNNNRWRGNRKESKSS